MGARAACRCPRERGARRSLPCSPTSGASKRRWSGTRCCTPSRPAPSQASSDPDRVQVPLELFERALKEDRVLFDLALDLLHLSVRDRHSAR